MNRMESISPSITVLIDAYNYGRYIDDAIQSVLNQTLDASKYEIVVIDDGSTDDTPQRVEAFGDRVRYIRKENGGQASAFNVGICAARGQWIALLDADDAWMPTKLSCAVDAIAQNPEAGLIYHQVLMWNPNQGSNEAGHFSMVSGNIAQSTQALLAYQPSPTSALVLRQDILAALLPIPETLRTQADAFLSCLCIFLAPVHAVAQPLTLYRIHGTNAFARSGEIKPDAIEHRMQMREFLVKSLREWLEKNGFQTGSKAIASYLKKWDLEQEGDRFLLETPSRWRFFRHLWATHHLYHGIRSPRHRLYSAIEVAAGLVFGYSHLE